VIQERRRYVPVGWSQAYEFTEADAHHGLDVLDSLIEKACGSKQNVSPDKVPFEAIRATLCKGVFGGRVTVPADQDILDTLVNSIFVPACFDVGFSLVPGAESDSLPPLPDSSSREDCLSWIESLASQTSPIWIGLDASAEATRAQMIANSVAEKYKDLDSREE
jgi:dynein heavy chain 1